MWTISRKWLVGFAVSVGLNLFLLGVLSVHLLRARGPHVGGHSPQGQHHQRVEGTPPHEGDGPRGDAARRFTREGLDGEGPAMMREMVKTLGGPEDPRVRALWERRRPELEKFREQRAAARAAVRQALLADPFQREALSGSLGTLAELSCEAQRNSSEALVELAEQLTPDERARIGRKEHRGPGRSPRPRRDEP